MKKGIVTALAIVTTGAVLMLTGCPTNPVDTPSVTWQVTAGQDGINFTWDAIQNADGYIVRYNGIADTIQVTNYTLSDPTSEVEIVAYKGDQESDPWTHSFAAVETQNIDWYTRADTDPSHPSGLGFNSDGSVVTISYANGNHNDIDFVADNDNTISGIEAVDTNINVHNGVAYDATFDYSTMKIAPATGYESYKSVVEGGTFALLKDSDGQPNNNDIYAKLKVKGIDGTRWTVDVTVQPIGGLRWLVK